MVRPPSLRHLSWRNYESNSLERAGHACTIDSIHKLASIALQDTDEFMCQSWGSSADELYRIGMALSEPARDRIVIKVPVTATGVEAAS